MNSKRGPDWRAVVHVARDAGMTAVEVARTCGAASEGGLFVWHLRCDESGLEGKTRRQGQGLKEAMGATDTKICVGMEGLSRGRKWTIPTPTLRYHDRNQDKPTMQEKTMNEHRSSESMGSKSSRLDTGRRGGEGPWYM